ncbi:M23 family metallopeptidase [candidate division WOR-3 bacterium]|nr:M23 family metallopeptidase [candidate division WOR-3 bacterium]
MNIHITIVPHSLSNIKHVKINIILLILIAIIIFLPVFLYKVCNFNNATNEVISLEREVDSLAPALEKMIEDYNYVEKMVEENERKVKSILKVSNFKTDIFYNVTGLTHREPDKLLKEIGKQRVLQNRIFDVLEPDTEILFCIPSIAPTQGRVIRHFGYTDDPFTGEKRFCQGIDMLAEIGEKVYATANGTVRFAGWKRHEGYTVEIVHKMGIVSRYSHLSIIKTKKGRIVERRDVIGLVGKTGKTEGPRLHYEIWKDNKPTNPLIYILESIEVI